ncbi:MAG: HEAT repeat domain-containing protein [Gemmataceae bacterium]|nr:HEAT repeat domain-containing protein [Gemmata sp.]MDW8199225.1 HEAT repeat domain-containing protein [Gemmataceae bacterium]
MRAASGLLVVGLVLVTALMVVARAEPDYYAIAATTPPPRVAEDAPEPATKKLIEELGSDDWRMREKASRELAALGEKALPYLRKALLDGDNPEVRQRLLVLVRRMERAVLVEPKRITLKAQDQTCKQILDAMAQQTGYRMEFQAFGPQAEAKYTFDFQNTPFWQAVDALANTAGLGIYPEYEDQVIRFYPQETVSPYVAYSGPFRLTATSIYSTRSIQLAGLPRRGEGPRSDGVVNLSVQIHSEPKNPMIGVTQPELTEAKDDRGGNLLPPRQPRNAYYPGYYNSGFRSHNTHISIDLKRSDPQAKLIQSLKGRVGITLLSGAVADIVIPEPLKAQKQTYRSRSVELELQSVTEDTNQKGNYTVALKLTRRSPEGVNAGEDWNWGNSIWQKLELIDAQGQRYYCHGPTNNTNNGTGTVQLTVVFGPEDRRSVRGQKKTLGPPAKLILQQWLTVTEEVPFEFRDIPLP